MCSASNVLRLGVTGLLYGILAQFVHTVSAYFSMDYYRDPEYFSIWSRLMMSTNGPPPANFFILSIFFSIIIGIALTLSYLVVEKALHGTVTDKGMCFGILVFLVGVMPQALTQFLLIRLPVELIWLWAFEGFILSLLGGLLIARMNKS